MRIKLFILISFAISAHLRAQVNNPLASCSIPAECQPGLIRFANDFLPRFPEDCKFWEGGCGFNNIITREGKVSIGGSESPNYQLGVWGKTITEQLRIALTEWPDYVYEDTFQLMPLNKMAKYLDTHHHLPNTPSQLEIIADGGYNMEQITPQQQQNIEEIFLHLVNLKKRMVALENQLETPLALSEIFPSEQLSQKNIMIKNTDALPVTLPVSPPVFAFNCNLFSQTACKEALSTFFQNNWQQPTCNQWEGICTGNGSGNQIFRMGEVCIGSKKVRPGYSLAVWGGIVTQNVMIRLQSTWPDYVFDPSYPLLPLNDLESFTQKNKHLPGMVSQAEVSMGGGFELRDVKLQQQVKIEEAYLHLLDLHERRKALEQRLSQY